MLDPNDPRRSRKRRLLPTPVEPGPTGLEAIRDKIGANTQLNTSTNSATAAAKRKAYDYGTARSAFAKAKHYDKDAERYNALQRRLRPR